MAKSLVEYSSLYLFSLMWIENQPNSKGYIIFEINKTTASTCYYFIGHHTRTYTTTTATAIRIINHPWFIILNSKSVDVGFLHACVLARFNAKIYNQIVGLVSAQSVSQLYRRNFYNYICYRLLLPSPDLNHNKWLNEWMNKWEMEQ